jgi:Gas vesicle synthesis protein GvpL/GvpF
VSAVADPLERWVAERAPALLRRAEDEAVALLRDHLVRAAVTGAAPTKPAITGHTPASHGAPPPATSGAGELLWAYGIVDADAELPLADLRGVAGDTPVQRVERDGLAALVSRVPRDAFDAEPLREHLNDLAWLERVARAHEAVLDAVLHATTVVPLRLCTIYASAERVRAMMADDRAALTAALAFLAGREEWGVKLLLDPARVRDHARADDEAAEASERDVVGRGEGGAYLQRRRADRALRARVDALAARAADDTHARLRAVAVDALSHPPQNRDLSGHEGDMVLNAAYLVEADAVDRLRERAAAVQLDLADLGARVEVTGPWPPYNFLPRDGAAAQP